MRHSTSIRSSKFLSCLPLLGILVALVSLSGCGEGNSDSNGGLPIPGGGDTGAGRAVAALEAKSGSSVRGQLTLEENKGTMGDVGVHIHGVIEGLAPNSQHGIHIHQQGDCSSPDASSAGEHFNPDGRAHGAMRTRENQTHAGDLGNILADDTGRATVNILAPVLSLDEGMFAVQNLSLIVHEKLDNFASQPAGESGARLACGVIRMQ